MQKVQLFSIEEQQRAFAWMNDRPTGSLPQTQPIAVSSIDPLKDTNAFMARVKLDVEEVVLFELSRHFRATNEVPAQIRMNPCSIFELPSERWHLFPFAAEGRMTMIPVVADPRVVSGRVHCVGCEETMVAVRAVGK